MREVGVSPFFSPVLGKRLLTERFAGKLDDISVVAALCKKNE